MQTDINPAERPDAGLVARLARRFELHMTDAERDYPLLEWQVRPTRSRPSARRRLGVAGAAIVLVAATLVGSQLPVWRSSTASATSQSPASSAAAPTASGVTMGADGIPISVAGEHVYRPADVLNGSASGTFLVGGDVVVAAPSCTPPPGPGCRLYAMGLGSGADMISVRGFVLDPESHAAVVRASLATCPPDNRGGHCQTGAGVFATEIVWTARPTAEGSGRLPEEIGGRPVLTVTDVQAIGDSTPFFLGGVVIDQYPPLAACPTGEGAYPMYPPTNEAEARLLPSGGLCDGRPIRQITAAGDTVDLAQGGPSLPDGALAVVLAHTHDPAAASCSAEYRGLCEQTVVVESIVWPPSMATATP